MLKDHPEDGRITNDRFNQTNNFGSGQFIYMLPGKVIDLGAVKRICDRYRPPYRIIDVLESNDGFLAICSIEIVSFTGRKDIPKVNTVDICIYLK